MSNPLIGMVGGTPTVAAGLDQSRPSPGGIMDGSQNRLVIDGTPIRVVVLAGAAALALVSLRWAGFKFNVGVST